MPSEHQAGGMAMDHDAVRAMAADSADLGCALRDMHRYHEQAGPLARYFGDTEHAAVAGARFASASASLGDTVGRLAAVAEQAAAELCRAADATRDADEAAARGLPDRRWDR